MTGLTAATWRGTAPDRIDMRRAGDPGAALRRWPAGGWLGRSLRLFPLALVIATVGCAHPRPHLNGNVPIPARLLLATEHPGVQGVVVRGQPTAQALPVVERHPALPAPQCQAVLGVPQAPEAERPSFLVLSGGSQNGAFGAGFFAGLRDARLLPRRPDVVTGVSTGSLQSTFLFLDKTFGDPAVPAGTRTDIDDLIDAYRPSREEEVLRPVPFGGIGLLLNGTMATLTPLRKHLLTLIDPDRIRRIAIEACRGRKLFVGVADVDDGQGYALDLTDLALSAYGSQPPRMIEVRKAYVSALIASSSVPVGAKPVNLIIELRGQEADKARATAQAIARTQLAESGVRPEHAGAPGASRSSAGVERQTLQHLFVDGGARFGVFLEDAGSGGLLNESGVTLIVNTTLAIKPWHGENLANAKEGWLLTTLGLRTVDILENQVYRLSVAAVEQRGQELGGLHMAYISAEGTSAGESPDDHPFADRDAAGELVTKTCGEWYQHDADHYHPLQFYVTYMRCLADYGRQRGAQADWNLVQPAAR